MHGQNHIKLETILDKWRPVLRPVTTRGENLTEILGSINRPELSHLGECRDRSLNADTTQSQWRSADSRKAVLLHFGIGRTFD